MSKKVNLIIIFSTVLFSLFFISCKEDNKCYGINCSGHGRCEIKNDEAICVCDNNYNVYELECIKIDEKCKNIDCSGHGICEIKDDIATCRCSKGYHADGNNCIIDEKKNSCKGIDCGAGSCKLTDNVLSCECDAGFNDKDNDLLCASDYLTVTAGGTGIDIGYGIIVDSHSNRWIVGEFTTSLDLGCENTLTATGESSGFIAKFDSNNRCKKLLALKGSEYVVPMDIATDGENIFISGSLLGNADLDPSDKSSDFTSNGEIDFFILKLNNEGNYLSAKSFGGSKDDYISTITIFDNNLYMVGLFEESVIFDTEPVISKGKSDFFILKLDNDLSYLNLYTNGDVDKDSLSDIVVTSDSIYVVGDFSGTINFATTGTDNRTAILSDGFILKLDHNFNTLWSRQIGGDLNDFLRRVVVDSEGNIKVAGSFTNSIDINWDNQGAEILTADGHYDMFVTSLKSDGTYLNTLYFEGTGADGDKKYSGDDWINDMFIDSEDNLYIVGQFSDDININPYDSHSDIIPEGNSDIFITSFKKDSYNFTYTIGNKLEDAAYDLALDNNKNLIVIGKFQDKVNFSSSTSTEDEHSSNGDSDIFIWNLNLK